MFANKEGVLMEGRWNEKTGFFEIFNNDKWVELNDKNWFFALRRIELDFLMYLCCNVEDPYKRMAIFELKRRFREQFDLKQLWIFVSNHDRAFGDLALNEIFKRNRNLLLPYYYK